jgi:hypothetical protein
MDRNGKKPKTARSDASRNAERSDMKANARGPFGRADAALGAPLGQGKGTAPARPAHPGRQGHRG